MPGPGVHGQDWEKENIGGKEKLIKPGNNLVMIHENGLNLEYSSGERLNS